MHREFEQVDGGTRLSPVTKLYAQTSAATGTIIQVIEMSDDQRKSSLRQAAHRR
jgi:hypothetical protein